MKSEPQGNLVATWASPTLPAWRRDTFSSDAGQRYSAARGRSAAQTGVHLQHPPLSLLHLSSPVLYDFDVIGIWQFE
ncbi:potassium channel subfamily T member 1-like isoform X8 [Arapaima gigas]